MVQIGGTLDYRVVRLEVSWSKGLSGQLRRDTQNDEIVTPSKAVDPMPDVEDPRLDFRAATMRLGLAVVF